MTLHRWRPIERVALCPMPSPVFANQDRLAALMAAEDVADLVQGNGIGTGRSDRPDPNLRRQNGTMVPIRQVACAGVSAEIDLDPIGLAEVPNVRPHLSNGYAATPNCRLFVCWAPIRANRNH